MRLKRRITGWLLVFCLTANPVLAQQGITKGAAVADIPVTRILNHADQSSSFARLKNKITIVDFFGTWCVPCLRALPLLNEIKTSFARDVNILLVSNETEDQLRRFISKRQPFPFPVIVDETNQWNALFQPPSLPYTLIIRGNRVIAITEAAHITPQAVQAWLEDSSNSTPVPTKAQPIASMRPEKSSNAAVALSQDFLYAAKTAEPVDLFLDRLASLSYPDLLQALASENEKKTFWINLYNGAVQAALQQHPEQYQKRNAFFRKKRMRVAGSSYSLDDLEHGMLRRSKIKWSLGYLNKPFPSQRERALRVQRVDYRIHFALNCGARSCPPVAFYSDAVLDRQLDVATKAYLASEAAYDSAANLVHLPKLMSWFRADFGGKKGIRRILEQQGIVPAGRSPKIRFNKYDWTLTLNNYTNQNP